MYEDASATKLLAVRCVICGRPLVDAISVESGMGPLCRSKYGQESQGYPDWSATLSLVDGIVDQATIEGWNGNARAAANSLTYRVAKTPVQAEALAYVSAIEALGYKKLSARIEERVRVREGKKVRWKKLTEKQRLEISRRFGWMAIQKP